MSIKSFLFGLDRRQAAQTSRPTIASSFISGTGFYTHRQADAYRNLFPYVASLAQQFSQLTPYAIDANGDKLQQTPLPLAAWLDPNPDNSGRQWARNIAASILYNPYTDILAITTDANGNYDPTAIPTPDNITGYIQLPPDSRRYNGNGSFTCTVRLNINGQAVQLQADRSHILTFTYSQHPERPATGISPAMTVKEWATVDDLIADYEKGFFANNAVPAGIMNIISQDAADYEDSKRRLEAAAGARNNNRVIYSPVFVDPATGQALQTGKVTFTPFQQANNTLDVGKLSDVISGRLANALGVPDIIRGIDNGQTYANAEQAYRNFITFTLRPFAVNIYDQLMHELQRITNGGLDWTITFDLQEPADTDQQKTLAEANQLNTAAFAQLINLGASPAQAAAALGLSDEWAELDAHSTTPPAITDGTTAATSASYAARQPLSQTRRKAQAAARRICRGAFKQLLQQTKAASFAADNSKKKRDDTAALAVATAAALLSAYEQLITQAADSTGDSLKKQLRQAARSNPAIAALLASTPNMYNDAAARQKWLQHLTADCSASFQDAQAHIQALLAEEDGEQAASRYLNQTRTPLLADNETHLTERHGQSLAAQAIAAHYANVAQVVKTWQTRGDDDVCEDCAAMEGTTIPASASFGANCEYDGQPSCHPNCRCQAVYTVQPVG